MKKTLRVILAILAATVIISTFEFVRNEFLFKSYWLNHYAKLGLVFPSENINGMVWGIWAFVMSIGMFIISRRFCIWGVLIISWIMGFILMWLALGNLGVLPFKLLKIAIPMSIIEVLSAAGAILKISPPSRNGHSD